MGDSKDQALKEKELGNAAYKKKDFETALQHYHKAIELNPSEMTFYTNIAAVHFEKKALEECIKNCDKAIEIGRENRADYKLISKALTRKANAYKELEDYENAKVFYEKSLTEHRTPQTRELLAVVEKKLKEKERLAYVDPEKSQKEKDAGNECFKNGNYADAVKHYTEAIKRNPEDAKIYSNRAAAYTKLAAFDLGLKDCDECIKLDPRFIKGYLRKANILKGLKKHSQASDVYQEAIELDGNCQEAIDGYRACMLESSTNPEEVRKRAMKNPEVQKILMDPAMRLILEQMQSDPRALQEHLRNPDIASKIQKLIEAGLIAIR